MPSSRSPSRRRCRRTVLDDLLWEKGRDDPDLIGDEAGDLSEPPRREGVVFY